MTMHVLIEQLKLANSIASDTRVLQAWGGISDEDAAIILKIVRRLVDIEAEDAKQLTEEAVC